MNFEHSISAVQKQVVFVPQQAVRSCHSGEATSPHSMVEECRGFAGASSLMP